VILVLRSSGREVVVAPARISSTPNCMVVGRCEHGPAHVNAIAEAAEHREEALGRRG
jgi:hypothetical protein